jgi:hypothetical protein
MVTSPCVFLGDRNSLKLKFVLFCRREHLCASSSSFETQYYFCHKRPGLPLYFFNNWSRRLFVSFRLNCFMFTWEFLTSGNNPLVCKCGLDLTTHHVLEVCEKLAFSRSVLKLDCGIQPGGHIAELFEKKEYLNPLSGFLNKIWFMLCGSDCQL